MPCDAAALGVGADQTAARHSRPRPNTAASSVELIRNGSRGLLWLEPLVEVDGRGHARRLRSRAAARRAGLVRRRISPRVSRTRLGHGATEEIPYFKKQERLTFARVGITDPRSLDDYLAHGGYRGLKAALALEPGGHRRRRDRLRTSRTRRRGLSRRASSGRPCSAHPARQKYIVCNADEGDSGTFSDRMLMEGDPFVLIEGMTIAGLAVGATRGYIYLRWEYPQAQARAARRPLPPPTRRTISGENIQGSGKALRSGSAHGRRCLHLRRGNLAAGILGRQARPGALQAAAAGDRRGCSASPP